MSSYSVVIVKNMVGNQEKGRGEKGEIGYCFLGKKFFSDERLNIYYWSGDLVVVGWLM